MASNLFVINHDEIKKLLVEANASLLRRRDGLLTKFNAVAEKLETDIEITQARDVAVELDSASRDVRPERLADEKPFKVAVGIVEEFYNDIETPLKGAAQTILARLTKAQNLPETLVNPILQDPSGRPIGIANSPRAVKRVWQVTSIDREKLDLEKLRKHLTDAVLLRACRKHLAEQRLDGGEPDTIAGVAYQKEAQLV